MARPKRNGPFLMKGTYYCEIYEGKRRRSLCLKTGDAAVAAERYGDGIRELRRRLRKEHEAQKQEENRPLWLPQEAIELRREYEEQRALAASTGDRLVSDLGPDELATRLTGRRGYDSTTGDLSDPETQHLAEIIAGLREMPVTWEELVANAETVRKRKTGRGYTNGWHRNIKTTLEKLDFSPAEATPVIIRRWMDGQEKKGIGSTTLKNRLSSLQGLIERAITSGYRPDLAPNGFKMVDFSVSKELESKRNYYCPTPSDYRKLFHEVLPQQPERIAVGIELMCWTGVRVSGVPYLNQSQEPGWLDVPDEDGTKKGGRAPVPMELWLRGKDLKISVRQLNKVLKEVHPELCNHGLRSGFKMLSRMAGIDSQLGESLLMHKLQGLESTYGGNDFPDAAKEKGAKAVWAELEKLINSDQSLASSDQ